MPNREGPPPEIFITPAGEKLWTIAWHILETPYKRSEARDTREVVRVDVAYELVWELAFRGYSIHNNYHYDELEDALLRDSPCTPQELRDRAHAQVHQQQKKEN